MVRSQGIDRASRDAGESKYRATSQPNGCERASANDMDCQAARHATMAVLPGAATALFRCPLYLNSGQKATLSLKNSAGQNVRAVYRLDRARSVSDIYNVHYVHPSYSHPNILPLSWKHFDDAERWSSGRTCSSGRSHCTVSYFRPRRSCSSPDLGSCNWWKRYALQ